MKKEKYKYLLYKFDTTYKNYLILNFINIFHLYIYFKT